MDVIRVLQVVRPMQGGMRRHVLDLIAGLQKGGLEVTVACPSELHRERELDGIPCLPLELVDGVHLMKDMRAVRQLAKLLREQSFDLVHLHGAKAGLVGRMARRSLPVPPPCVYTVHNQVLPRGGLVKRVLNTLERRLAPETDRVITVSHRLEQDVVATHGVPPWRTVTIHNGVEQATLLPRDHARQILGCEDSDRLVIGAIGRMVEEKGFSTLLEAFTILLARRVDAELVLIGDGPLLSDYQQVAGKIGPARVRFLGEVPQARRLLSGLDIVVQPSHAEGLGLVPIEAMLAARPVIASAVGGLPEVVIHGKTGLLVPPQQAVALADALQLLLQKADWRMGLGLAGQRRAEELFTRQAMIEATLREYRAVVAKRQGVML
ncbi:hypothetical protein CIG75_15405 [Tumebacillus algifaecis]|uniref:Glycosyltransferase subfamily 4-like N-terminal domain-containing protein n=1 Tax=Tumebacillus algifaecis TaxID=1214604 RepID=A0A223D3H1_9BACL|nr:glycosyltransferase family 4 protein [Tumebacillus algifaecis]ASS76189.1 hypothetical protein CIG75_15405 [Tumebacillus algifaecis]